MTMSTLLPVQTATTRHESRKRRVFTSIFPPPNSASTPTPLATPASSFVTAPSQPSPALGTQSFSSQTIIQRSRAWHLATTFLSFPNSAFHVAEEESFADVATKEGLYVRRKAGLLGKDTKDSIGYLVRENSVEGESLVEWYTCEVRRHFLEYVRPSLAVIETSQSASEQQLSQILSHLKVSSNIYNSMFTTYLLPPFDSAYTNFTRSLHSIIAFALPATFPGILYKTLYSHMAIILSLPSSTLTDANVALFTSPHIPALWEAMPSGDLDLELDEEEKEHLLAEETARRREEARAGLIVLVEGLESVGLMGNAVGERVLSGVVDVVVGEWVASKFSGSWRNGEEDDEEEEMVATERETPTSRTVIEEWLAKTLTPLITSVLAVCSKSQSTSVETPPPQVSMLLQRLSVLRMTEMFDMVVDHEHSGNAILDLMPLLTSQSGKTNLATSFIAQLNTRLLHPGASTVDILRVYISMIKVFYVLDSKGVLLERVGSRVRRYLNSREDTVVEIVKGILSKNPEDDDDESDIEDEDSIRIHEDGSEHRSKRRRSQSAEVAEEEEGEECLRELASELVNSAQTAEQAANGLGAAASTGLDELDFEDMNWIPDPIDAGPEYRKSQGTDIISHLLTLQTQEQFMREFQIQLGKRLLYAPARSEFAKETQTLELLKLRFGEAPVNFCSVMLRDVIDSRRVDIHVHNAQTFIDTFEKRPPPDVVPEIHGKILSRVFWPELSEAEFSLPPVIESILTRFGTGFEGLKSNRKLKWVKGEGTVEVELALADRALTFQKVPTHAATVIYAFDDENEQDINYHDDLINGGVVGVKRTMQQLVETIRMPDGLIKRSLAYWIEKKVLGKHPELPGVFYVLETLPQSTVASNLPAPWDTLDLRSGTTTTARPRSLSAFSSSSGSVSSDEQPTTRRPLPTPAKPKEKEREEAPPEELSMQEQMIQAFTKGMLTNLGVMSTESIFGMLGNMLPGGVNFGEAHLYECLMRMVQAEMIERVRGGVGGAEWRNKK